HGRVALAGVVGQAPSFDTVGWLAREPRVLAAVGEVILARPCPAAQAGTLIALEEAFALADAPSRAAAEAALARVAAHFARLEWRALSQVPLTEWFAHQGALQGWEAWRTFGGWIDSANPRFSFEVADNFLRGARIDDTAAQDARRFAAARREEVLPLLADGALLALPSAPFPAPLAGQPRSRMWALRARMLQLTCIAGTLGCPQVSLPLARVDGLPLGLSLIGAPGADERLLAVARTIVS
ncbi:MAG TPA: amidase family protein, partial [Burkholderiales bacterium]|nr:amidase family protein [Burkholderiales bacterium]